MQTYLPSIPLRAFIKTYLIIESEDELVNRTLPDTSLVMSFRYKGQISFLMNDTRESLSTFMLSGLRKSVRLIHYAKKTGNLLVIFKEAAAASFIKEPLHELFEESVSLDNLTTYKDLSMVEERLAEATHHVERIQIVEQFLLSRLHRHSVDQLIGTALERLHQSHGLISITDLAKTLYISQDAFEKRFRKTVGISPKQFSNIVRMRSIMHRGLHHQKFYQTALEAGFFDQPHFNKEFKLFTGQSPTDFLKSPIYW